MAACAEIEEELSAYLDGETSPETRASIDEHLRGCTACQAVLAELKSIRNVLSDLPKLKAPVTLASAIHNEIVASPAAAHSAPAAAQTATANIDKSIDWKAATRPKQSVWAPVGFGIAAMLMLCLLAFVVVPAIMKNRPGELSMKSATQERVAADLSDKSDLRDFPKSAGEPKFEELSEGSIAAVEEQKQGLRQGSVEKLRKAEREVTGGMPPAPAPAAAAPLKSGSEGGGSAEARYKGAAESRKAAGPLGAANTPAAPPSVQSQKNFLKKAETAVEGKGRQLDPAAPAAPAEPAAQNGKNAEKALADADRVAQKPVQETGKAVRQIDAMQRADNATEDLKQKAAKRDGTKSELAAKAAPGAPPLPKRASNNDGGPQPEMPTASAPKPVAAPQVAALPAPAQSAAAAKDAQKEVSVENKKQSALAEDARQESRGAGGAGAKAEQDAAPFRRRSADAKPELQKKSDGKDAVTEPVMVFQTANPEQLYKQIQSLAQASGARIEFSTRDGLAADKAVKENERLPIENQFRTGQPAVVSLLAAAGQREALLSKLRNLQAQFGANRNYVEAGENLAGGKAEEKSKLAAGVPAEEPANKPAATVAPAAKADEAIAFAAAPEDRIVIRIEVLRVPGADANVKRIDK